MLFIASMAQTRQMQVFGGADDNHTAVAPDDGAYRWADALPRVWAPVTTCWFSAGVKLQGR